MQVKGGTWYCGADAKPKVWQGTEEGLEGEFRQVLVIQDDHVIYQGRKSPPTTVPLDEFQAWAVSEVKTFLGRWAKVK